MGKKVLDPRIYEIAKKIKQLRIEAGYTSYEAFAKSNGFDRMQYGRLERGTNFTIETLFRVVDAFEMPLQEFFGEYKEAK